MSITKVRTKSAVYVYESTPRWVPELGQSRPTKKYLGKEDPVTGELIPATRKRRSSDAVAGNSVPSATQSSLEAVDQVQQLKAENEQLRAELSQAKANIDEIAAELSDYKAAFKNISIQIDKLKQKS